MTPRPRVFVSHSAKDPSARRLLERLVARLAAAGFYPVVDYQTQPGELWRTRLIAEVRSAHAVVFLVSEHALNSDWVRRECIYALADRVDVRGLRRVFVARMASVSASQLRDSILGAEGLGEIQSVTISDEDDIERIVEALEAIRSAYSSGPNTLVESTVDRILSTASGASLQVVAGLLGIDPAPHQAAELRATIVRRILAEAGDPLRGIALTSDLLELLLPALSDWDGRILIDLSFAFAVLPEQVRRQLSHLADKRPTAIATLAVSRAHTVNVYVRRASELPWPWHTYIPVAAREAFLPELLLDIRSHILAELGFLASEEQSTDNAEVLRELDHYERTHGPMVVVLTTPPEGEVVTRLTTEFPRLIFIFVVGEQAVQPDEPPTCLEPALDRAVEIRLLRAVQQMRNRISQRAAPVAW